MAEAVYFPPITPQYTVGAAGAAASILLPATTLAPSASPGTALQQWVIRSIAFKLIAGATIMSAPVLAQVADGGNVIFSWPMQCGVNTGNGSGDQFQAFGVCWGGTPGNAMTIAFSAGATSVIQSIWVDAYLSAGAGRINL